MLPGAVAFRCRWVSRNARSKTGSPYQATSQSGPPRTIFSDENIFGTVVSVHQALPQGGFETAYLRFEQPQLPVVNR